MAQFHIFNHRCQLQLFAGIRTCSSCYKLHTLPKRHCIVLSVMRWAAGSDDKRGYRTAKGGTTQQYRRDIGCWAYTSHAP